MCVRMRSYVCDYSVGAQVCSGCVWCRRMGALIGVIQGEGEWHLQAVVRRAR